MYTDIQEERIIQATQNIIKADFKDSNTVPAQVLHMRLLQYYGSFTIGRNTYYKIVRRHFKTVTKGSLLHVIVRQKKK